MDIHYKAKNIALLIQELNKRKSEEKIFFYFPKDNELSIDNYKKHYEFFQNGSFFKVRAFIAGNRCGKTEALCYEAVCHALGWYPDWWTGKRFDKPVKIALCGDTKKTIRDIIQVKLLGDSLNDIDIGKGLIPKKYIVGFSKNNGAADSIDYIDVNRMDGNGISRFYLKSYDAGRKTFQGTNFDIAICDEEPPLEVFQELMIRLMTTDGIGIIGFTPMEGMTRMIQEIYDQIKEQQIKDVPKVYSLTTATWNDVPHLTQNQKDLQMQMIPPYMRDARMNGIPVLGEGAIWPVNENDFLVNHFPIPEEWKRCFAMDVGWNRTAILFGAIDPNTNIVYIYDEIYEGNKQPHEHARTIKVRGDWIPGIVDPASCGRSQADGKQLYQMYVNEGLSLTFANNKFEAGVVKVWEMLSQGKIKVFKNLLAFQSEFRIYQRDVNGDPKTKKDHLMDALRYFCMGYESIAINKIQYMNKHKPKTSTIIHKNSWMS